MKAFRIFVSCAICGFWSISCESGKKDRVAPRVDYVSCRYMPDDSFKGILEAIDGKETKACRVYLRSDARNRAGFYFIISLDGAVGRLKNGTIFTIQYITTENNHVREYSWRFDEKYRSPLSEFYAGLTSSDEQITSNAKLLAWKCFLKNEDGSIISSKQSDAWQI